MSMLLALLVSAVPSWRSSSTLALDPKAETLFVADSDRREVARIAVGRAVPLPAIRLREGPAQIAVGANGTVFATLRLSGAIVRIDTEGTKTATVGGEPYALALSDDERRLFVTLATEARVLTIDAIAMAPIQSTPVLPDPRPIILSDDGRLFIGHVKTGTISVVDAKTGERLDDLDPARRPKKWRRSPLFDPKRAQTWALLLAREAEREHLLVVQREVRTGLGLMIDGVGYGGKGPRQLVVIDKVPIDRPGAIGKLGTHAAITGPMVAASTGKRLLISAPGAEGVHEVKGGEIDIAHEIAGGAIGMVSAGATIYLLSGERRLYSLRGHRLRRIAVLDPSPLPSEMLRGRRLFFSGGGEISRDGVSCGSCHPEGRDDGLVWNLDGRLRQTPSLAGRLADTAPYNWSGSEPELAGNIRKTIERLRGDGLSNRSLHALTRYLLEGLTAPVARIAGDVEEGRKIFAREDVGCAGCHLPEMGFTDGLTHELGTWKDDRMFDTPSLRHLALTAPYLHDGTAKDIESVLIRMGDRMGKISHLTLGERAALIDYLRSL